MADWIGFMMWVLLCALMGWLAERKGRHAARWIGFALVVSVLVYGVSFYNAQQEMFFSYAPDGTMLGRNPAATPSGWPPLLVAFLVLLAAAVAPYRNRKRCPDCGETIQADARICRHCRYAFDQAARIPNTSRA